VPVVSPALGTSFLKGFKQNRRSDKTACQRCVSKTDGGCVAEEGSVFRTRARTHSVVTRDSRGAVLNRWKGIFPAESNGVLQDLRKKHPTLTVTRHLDIHSECWACNGTGLRPTNKRYLCNTCEGTGRLISDELGVEV
jgi:hypothetical protein